MSEHYPRIRIRAEDGTMLVREGLSFSFYMRRFHEELLPVVLRSLETYRTAVGEGLGIYWDEEAEYPHHLDAAGWELVMRDLNAGRTIRLNDVSGRECRYRFDYLDKPANLPTLKWLPGWNSAVTCWMPTEYLEEHGPAQVRALALALAAPLPFCSGQVGLSFNGELDMLGVRQEIEERCFRYPGFDIPDVEHLSWDLGTRVRGPAWLTFLGQPVLGELGGATGLRSRLHTPGTTVEELDAERVVVALGEWPDAGDTEQGNHLPAYRELARVLEPWLFHEKEGMRGYFSTFKNLRRWERRFLD